MNVLAWNQAIKRQNISLGLGFFCPAPLRKGESSPPEVERWCPGCGIRRQTRIGSLAGFPLCSRRPCALRPHRQVECPSLPPTSRTPLGAEPTILLGRFGDCPRPGDWTWTGVLGRAWVFLSASYPPCPDGPATTAWPAGVWGSREAPRTQADLSLTLGGSTACSRCGGMALSGRTMPLNLRPVPQPLPPVPSTGQSEFSGFWGLAQKSAMEWGWGQAPLEGWVLRNLSFDVCRKVRPTQLHPLIFPIIFFSSCSPKWGCCPWCSVGCLSRFPFLWKQVRSVSHWVPEACRLVGSIVTVSRPLTYL